MANEKKSFSVVDTKMGNYPMEKGIKKKGCAEFIRNMLGERGYIRPDDSVVKTEDLKITEQLYLDEELPIG